MIRFATIMISTCFALGAWADIVVPVRTIRADAVIKLSDLGIKTGENQESYDRPEDVAGQEARVTLYAGRPIRFDDIGPPAIVDRNQVVPLRFEAGGLLITAEGRSLQRGGVGDRVRIMNLSSRNTLFGLVQADGSVEVRK